MTVRIICKVNRWAENANLPHDQKPGFCETAFVSTIRHTKTSGFIAPRGMVHDHRVMWQG